MKKKKILSDYVFTLFRNALNVVIPLITLPFVLNRIGAENYGVFTYANSIVSYFTMIAVLGIPSYAARAVAREKGIEEIKKTVTEIFLIQLISVSLAVLIYLLIIFPLFPEEYKYVFTILSILLFANYFHVEWFYIGQQKFKFIAIRATVIKVLNITTILLLVHESDNCYTYAYITALTSTLTNTINFFGIIKYLKFKKLDFKMHLKPIFMLFSLSIAGVINSNIDKTLIGALVGPLYVGYYAIGYKITRIIRNLFSALNVIITPRIFSLLADNKEEKSKQLITININYVLLLSLPIIFGIYLYGQQILSLFFKADILNAYKSLVILTGIIPAQAILSTINTHILLARDKEKSLIILTVTAMVINTVLNVILIPTYMHVGAAIATLLANYCTIIISLIYINKQFGICLFYTNQIKYVFSTFSLLIPYWFFNFVVDIPYTNINLLLEIISSIVIYFFMILLVNDDLFSFYIRKYLKRYDFLRK